MVETNYCITLDRIPEELYPEIAANDDQREEWVRLFAIDEIEGDLTQPTYSVPLTVEFLKANPYLVLDTAFFSAEFKDKLIAGVDNLDENLDGLLIHSENFQALQLLQTRYKGQIKCIYIDPPYNAKSSEILYKNNYKHSSWLSLMSDRIKASQTLFNDKPVFICAIDEVEQERLGILLSQLFNENYFGKTAVSIVHNPSGQQGDNFSYTHEFAYFIYNIPGRSIAEQLREDPNEWDKRNFRDVTGDESLRTAAKTCFYPILIKDGTIIGFGDVCNDDYHPEVNVFRDDGVIEVYPIDPQGIERKWRFGRDTVETIKDQLLVNYINNRKVYDIQRLKKTFNYKSCWHAYIYSANNYGTQPLNQMFGYQPFSYPKSIFTVKDCIYAGLNEQKAATVLDFFAGSGTTAHAVINLNREDGGRRKYLLVEMGEYFDTVTKPRIQKVIYSMDTETQKGWRDGKPVSRKGSSHAFKYLRLESYEDTLNNIVLRGGQYDMLGSAREGYLLSYMLDAEAEGSSCLLNIDKLDKPFDYKMNITRNLEPRAASRPC